MTKFEMWCKHETKKIVLEVELKNRLMLKRDQSSRKGRDVSFDEGRTLP